MPKPTSDPRQRLLDAGLKLFANRGYAGAAVHDITEEAKVTKPTLYYYFENKEGLFQALVDQAMDERLRLMRKAAPPDKSTVDQLTDIIVLLTGFARRQPDLLRLCFSIAFAAEGEFPSGFKKHDKMRESYQFVRDVIQVGIDRGVLNRTFAADELAQSYFQLVQHAIVLTIIEPKLRRIKPPMLLPPQMEPRRIVELFLSGAAKPQDSAANGNGSKNGSREPVAHNGKAIGRLRTTTASRLARTLGLFAALGLSLLSARGQTTNATTIPSPAISPVPVVTNYPPADSVQPPTMTAEATNNAAAPASLNATNAPPDLADIREVPLAVQASHPELALVSPVAVNARDPRALDLETCFQLTAIRDDSLKISLQDVRIAQAELSQSIAGLWPTFTASNQQQFLHYTGPSAGLSFSSFGVPVGGNTGAGASTGTGTGTTGSTGGATATGGSSGTTITATQGQRNYESQSSVTMNYTIFNGGQNYNTVGASRALVAARRQTMARDYETIYQDVAQAFYNVLQYEGDQIVQNDLIEALQARVVDLKDRVSLGRSRPSEFLQAETDLANARVTFQADLGSSNAALETLAFYTGIPAAELKLKDTQKFPTVDQLEFYLRQSGMRPDVLSDVELLRQSERNLSVARGELFPTVSASGNYLASQDPVSNNIDATMTLQISMPIFDGGLILAQIHQNKEMVRESALNLEQLQRTADQDTRTAYANFNASVAQVVVLREAAVLSAKNLVAQVDDYRRGIVSNLDVLTALQDYQTARVQLHNANMQSRLDLINLHVAAGMAARGPNANNLALPKSIGTAP
jgi:outer membrane protein